MLNDTRIRHAKPGDREYKLSDFDGLYLLVRPRAPIRTRQNMERQVNTTARFMTRHHVV